MSHEQNGSLAEVEVPAQAVEQNAGEIDAIRIPVDPKLARDLLQAKRALASDLLVLPMYGTPELEIFA